MLRFRLHALEGLLKDHYAAPVPGSWRVTLRFEDGEAVDVDYDCGRGPIAKRDPLPLEPTDATCIFVRPPLILASDWDRST